MQISAKKFPWIIGINELFSASARRIQAYNQIGCRNTILGLKFECAKVIQKIKYLYLYNEKYRTKIEVSH